MRRGHDGKKRFKTRDLAERQARITLERCGHIMTPYQCRYCDKWHLGHDVANRVRTLDAAFAARDRMMEARAGV